MVDDTSRKIAAAKDKWEKNTLTPHQTKHPDRRKEFFTTSSKPVKVLYTPLDLPNFDYRLTKDSPAINAGTDPGVIDGFNLVPEWQYVHPMKKQKRTICGNIDVGAYEFSKE